MRTNKKDVSCDSMDGGRGTDPSKENKERDDG